MAAPSLAHHDKELALHYDENSSAQFEGGLALAEMINIREGDRVLDVGCGPGRLAAHLAPIVKKKGGFVVGIDPLEEFINMAAEKASSNLSFEKMAADEVVQFGPALFTAAVFCTSFNWVPDPLGALLQAAFVLEQGARLAIVGGSGDHLQPHHEIKRRVLERHGLPFRAASLLTHSTLENQLERTRFSNAKITARLTIMVAPDAKTMVKRVNASQCGNYLGNVPEYMWGEIEEEFEKLRTDEGIRLETMWLYAIATKETRTLPIWVDFQLTPPSRVERMRNAMAQAGLGGLVCSSPQNVFQFSNVNPCINSTPGFIILTRDNGDHHKADLALLVHGLRAPLASDTPGHPRICTYGEWIGEQLEGTTSMGSTWQEALAALLKGCGGKIGVERHDLAAIGPFDTVPAARLDDARSLIMECRIVKDPDQIANAWISADLSDAALDAAEQTLPVDNCTGVNIFAAGSVAMLKRWETEYPKFRICSFGHRGGGTLNGLGLWALSGPDIFHSCGPPSTNKIAEGEMVSVGFWPCAEGMHNELERTLWKGRLSASNEKALADIEEIQLMIIQAAGPDVACSALFEIYCVEMKKRGYEDYIAPRIGHVIGLDPHEPRSIDAKTHDKLAPWTFITIEPHIIISPVCRTQRSDTVLITRTGRVVITMKKRAEMFQLAH